MLHNILAAYDGSESSTRAFQFALEIGKRFEATLTVLSVVQFPEPVVEIEETSEVIEEGREHFQKEFEKLRREAASQSIELQTHIAVGHPAEQIIHYANEIRADLIVLGHRGKGMVERWLVGSISKRVITYAHCSVMIVR